MVINDKATQEQAIGFKERKNNLYVFLNDDVKSLGKPDDDEKELFMVFLDNVLGKIEMLTAWYSYGNGQIDLDVNSFCPNHCIIFNILKKISLSIASYIGVRMGNFKFIFKENHILEKITFWFDIDGLYDDNDCYAQCDDYELIINETSFIVKQNILDNSIAIFEKICYNWNTN